MPEVNEHGARPKTYKREVAGAVIVAVGIATAWTFYRIEHVEEWRAQTMVGVLSAIAVPALLGAFSMFGVDAFGKQIRRDYHDPPHYRDH